MVPWGGRLENSFLEFSFIVYQQDQPMKSENPIETEQRWKDFQQNSESLKKKQYRGLINWQKV